MKTSNRHSLTLGLPALAALAMVPASAQDASKIQPAAYRVVVDNPKVRVLEYTSKPGMGVCGSGMHSHPAHLTVVLTPARVRVNEGGKIVVVTNKVGDTFWSGPVTHEVDNLGGTVGKSLIIEVKTPDSGGH